MRVVLLGSSRPAVVALETLLRSQAEVVGAGAHLGERIGALRGSLLEAAAARGIPTVEFDPERRDEIDRFVRSLEPDVGFAVGFRYLLAPETLKAPEHGWLNIHSSLLPAYRGRAPVNWAILQGERELGATLHVIDEGVDAGDIVFQERFELADHEDVADALRKLDTCYEVLVEKAVRALASDSLPRTPMPAGKDRLWPRRTAEDGAIDWTRTAGEVVRLVRAVAPPYPGAFTWLSGRRLYIYKARVGPRLEAPMPGLVAGPFTIHAVDAAVEALQMVIQSENAEFQTVESLASHIGTVCGR